MNSFTPFSSNAPALPVLPLPALALDIRERDVSALLHAPGPENAREDAREYRWTLPSPDRVAADSIHAATRQGLDVFLQGSVIGKSAALALREHRAAGFGVCLHPRTTLFPKPDSALLRRLGITVSEQAPSGSERIAVLDISPAFWSTLCNMSGLPRPEAILVSAVECGTPLDDDEHARPNALRNLFSRLEEPLAAERSGQDGAAALQPGGIPVERILSPRPVPGLLRLNAIRRLTGDPATDVTLAAFLDLLSQKGVSERARREGVTLLRLGAKHLTAALVFRDRFLSFLELRLDKVLPGGPEDAPKTLPPLLDDFRLGWLPEETARDLGGMIWRAGELPPQAEGFKPAFATGKNAALLEGFARIMPPPHPSSAVSRCRGLLYGYARMLEAGGEEGEGKKAGGKEARSKEE